MRVRRSLFYGPLEQTTGRNNLLEKVPYRKLNTATRKILLGMKRVRRYVQ